MAITIEVNGNKFRVIGQEINTDWLEDTHENRKAVLIILRLLRDREGKPIFTLEELATIMGSTNRQAASKYIERFHRSGEDIHATLHNNSRANQEIREVIREVLMEDPLATHEEIARKVNERMGRTDVTNNHVDHALDEIRYSEVRAAIKRKLEAGKYQYKEEELIRQLFRMVLENSESQKEVSHSFLKSSLEASVPQETYQHDEIEQSANAEEAKKLFDEQNKVEDMYSIWQSPLGWYMLAFTLYFQGVSTAAIGSWFGLNKSTICRWLSKVADWADNWIDKAVAFSGSVAVDEKMILIGGIYYYFFAAVDCTTGYPLLTAIYSSNSINYCTLFLAELKRKGYNPKAIITDGWDGYIKAIALVFPKAEHLLCRVHVLRSIFRRMKKSYIFGTEIFKAICNLFKTDYKRTVDRRIEKAKGLLEPHQVEAVLGGLFAKKSQVIKAVGSSWRPSTSNSVERFFGQFDRFYRLKGPFPDEKSAQKHLKLFMLGYLFSIGHNGQACPLEKASQNVASIPFYHLLNKPNIIALKERIAEQYKGTA